MLRPANSKQELLNIKSDTHVSRDFLNRIHGSNTLIRNRSITLHEAQEHVLFYDASASLEMICAVSENANSSAFKVLEGYRNVIFGVEWHSKLCPELRKYVTESVENAKKQKSVASVASLRQNLALVKVNSKVDSVSSKTSKVSSKPETDGRVSIYSDYQFDKLRDLLKLIRNLLRHSKTLEVSLKNAIGLTTYGMDHDGFNIFLHYFSSRFPALVISVFNVGVRLQISGVKSSKFSRFFDFKDPTLCAGSDYESNHEPISAPKQ